MNFFLLLQSKECINKQGATSMAHDVAIFIFDEVEVLDFCGPFEVFSLAGRLNDAAAFNVYTVAEELRPVRARGGLSVNPHHTLADCPPPDIVVVPGGYGARREQFNQPVLDWIAACAQRGELMLSVCTGALLLGRAGLLDGLQATTHHAAFDLLRDAAPHATIKEDDRVVDNGNIVMSAGISAGIDASLHVVARLLGDEHARATARQMEYDWEG
jgi:transcriptional regulator GlxA family with amidase domain